MMRVAPSTSEEPNNWKMMARPVRHRWGGSMAARKKAAARKAAKKGSGELIISKSRVKAATRKCNVGSEFYVALDQAVRKAIADAEARALANKRKTLKPQDL